MGEALENDKKLETCLDAKSNTPSDDHNVWIMEWNKQSVIKDGDGREIFIEDKSDYWIENIFIWTCHEKLFKMSSSNYLFSNNQNVTQNI